MARYSRAWIKQLLADWGIEGGTARFSLEDLLSQVEARTGYPLKVLPVPLPYSPSGLLVRAEGFDVDLILVAEDTNFVHRQHICVHELAHLICHHKLFRLSADRICAIAECQVPAEQVKAILRSAYVDEQEREAEAIAAYFLENLLVYVPLIDERLFETAKHYRSPIATETLQQYLSDLDLI